VIADVRRVLGDAPKLCLMTSDAAQALGAMGRDEASRIRYADAVHLCETLAPGHPDGGVAHLRLGELLLAAGRPEEASEHASTAWKLFEQAEGDATFVAEARFLAARAQYSDRSRRKQAVESARAARDVFVDAGLSDLAAEVARWLASHG
jgi:tetratricopeptide (TPR) repeat protein